MSAKSKKVKSTLDIIPGVEPSPQINEEMAKKFRKSHKEEIAAQDYINAIKNGNKTLLSKAITLIESSLSQHYSLSQEVIKGCLPFSGKSIRIGITGVPGVGKSTFIESFGKLLTAKGHKVAVLAIDPSSERTKGSILGDKTRMEELSKDPSAYIRPSPTSGSLGGVARKTKESIILCEAAGFDIIIVETVGVGQSETNVHSMVDFFLLLMLAGAGDELQGIKRGIMELADAIIINKADGDNIQKALIARQEYKNALHLFPPTQSGWIPRTEICSASNNTRIQEIWEIIEEYFIFSKNNDYFFVRRKEQEKIRLHQYLLEMLKENIYQNPAIKEKIKILEKDIFENKISSFMAAQILFDDYSHLK